MSRAYVSNIANYLDETGAVHSSLTVTAQRLLKQMSIIIDFISTDPSQRPLPHLQCFGKLAKKRCKGKLDASIALPYYDIVWHCLVCGNHGNISNWKGTVLDATLRPFDPSRASGRTA